MKRQIEKCRQQLDKFVNKVEKRIDTRMKEERNVNEHRLEQMEQMWK